MPRRLLCWILLLLLAALPVLPAPHAGPGAPAPTLVFTPGPDHAVLESMGWAGVFVAAPDGTTHALAISLPAGASVVADRLFDVHAPAGASYSFEVAAPPEGPGLQRMELRFWSGRHAPGPETAAAPCAVLDLRAPAGTPAEGRCRGPVHAQAAVEAAAGAHGSFAAAWRPAAIAPP